MGLQRVWLIPLATFAFSLTAFVVSYCIAVSQGTVTAIWPYISDTGNFAPASCVFGELLNIAALFLACTVYLRHRQIVEFYWHRLKQTGRWRSTSCCLLYIGYASALGVCTIANFQEGNVILIHYAGALLAFGAGLIYVWAQTVFSYLMNPKLAKPVVSHCRLALCIAATFFFCTMLVFGPILGRHPDTLAPNEHGDLYKWHGTEPNYIEHVIGTTSEWLLAICFQFYILSFAIELRYAHCHAPKLKLIAFLDGPSSAISPDVFDSCVMPAALLSAGGVKAAAAAATAAKCDGRNCPSASSSVSAASDASSSGHSSTLTTLDETASTTSSAASADLDAVVVVK